MDDEYPPLIKDSDKEEHMEIDQIKNNQSESPDILEPSVDKPSEQIEGTPEETVKTVSSGDEHIGEDHPIAKPTNAHTDNNTTKRGLTKPQTRKY